MKETNVYIPSISCMHCVHTIKRELKELDGVSEVTGDATTKKVTISWTPPATWEQITETLNEIGYPPKE